MSLANAQSNSPPRPCRARPPPAKNSRNEGRPAIPDRCRDSGYSAALGLGFQSNRPDRASRGPLVASSVARRSASFTIARRLAAEEGVSGGALRDNEGSLFVYPNMIPHIRQRAV